MYACTLQQLRWLVLTMQRHIEASMEPYVAESTFEGLARDET